MTAHWAVVSVGSNIDPVANVAEARRLIDESAEWPVLRIRASSRFIRTTPRGSLADQPDFLNGAFLIETEAGLDRLRSCLKSIEDQMGRVRGPVKEGPRNIDLDVVIFDGLRVDDDFERYDFVRESALQLVEAESDGVSFKLREPL